MPARSLAPSGASGTALLGSLRTLGARSIAIVALLVAGILVTSTFAVTPDAEAASQARIKKAMKIVVNQKGDPYSYGSAGPNRFDCSGLTYYSFRKAGIKVPRTSGQQANFARRIPRKHMRRGDLVFFYDRGGVYHMGVYAGRSNGSRKIVHAPYGNKRVTKARIWTNNWYAGTLRRRR